MRHLYALLLCGLLALPAAAATSANPRVDLQTDLGTIRVELFADKSPITVENFLGYVDRGFYNGVIFHRVIPGFVAQTGGLTFDFQRKETVDPIANESANGLRNTRGTLGMARFNDPDSATSQFYINLGNNQDLDPKEDKAGYTVFGRVIEGMDVVDKIVAEPRGLHRAHPQAPNIPVRILKAKRLDSRVKTNSQP
ncbi:peptidyl-prolyl cis-trans isomerase A [Microbulbifer aestuariivivens]|uniref:Peptidyl-prolyl cis-trans isomerase n=1 Tax=Microbulbifer aestuariivivens TaxID=1908308 RepID=A0ABP9WL08_9GAMM